MNSQGTGKGFSGRIDIEGFPEPIDFFAQTIGPAKITGIKHKLDIKLFDSVQTPIGATDGPQDAPANVPINLDSKLPFVMIVTAQNIDDDPIKFAYAGQNFDSNAGQCSVGRYDSGKREMDCGFTC
ncbi:hypothetical protein DL96DRAFT_1633972 [Flagelloscypha sp. PMI_526]|nr:hypothetical protein DL96DRAFT_1633972 [Flagelloscypha sp. PMI_526]